MLHCGIQPPPTQLTLIICTAGTVQLSDSPEYLNPSYIIEVVFVHMRYYIIIRQYVLASITSKLTRWQNDLSVVRFGNSLALLRVGPLKVRKYRL